MIELSIKCFNKDKLITSIILLLSYNAKGPLLHSRTPNCSN